MARERRRRPGFKRIGFVAVALVAGWYGVFRLAQWHHSRKTDRRVEDLSGIIWRHARANALPTGLVRAIIRAESGGDPRAVSDKKARGLMQIMPITEREVRKHVKLPENGDLFDPDYNVLVGTTYLRMLINRFDGDAHLALAGYHMGPTRVQGLRNANPRLSGRELIEKHGPRVTARYCRGILKGKSLRLPVTKGR